MFLGKKIESTVSLADKGNIKKRPQNNHDRDSETDAADASRSDAEFVVFQKSVHIRVNHPQP